MGSTHFRAGLDLGDNALWARRSSGATHCVPGTNNSTCLKGKESTINAWG